MIVVLIVNDNQLEWQNWHIMRLVEIADAKFCAVNWCITFAYQTLIRRR